MTELEAKNAWINIVANIKNGAVHFKLWKDIKSAIDTDLKDYASSLITAFSKGLIDFMAYRPDGDTLVIAPRRKVPQVDFIFIYKGDNKYHYFGINRTENGLNMITNKKVKMAFADLEI